MADTYCVVRSPITAAAHYRFKRYATSTEDCIEVFRLFEDCMDFSEEGSDGWNALCCLADDAFGYVETLSNYKSIAAHHSILLWALKFFSSEVRANFQESEVVRLVGYLIVPNGPNGPHKPIEPEEALEILLGLGSNLINSVGMKGGYSILLEYMSYAESLQNILLILKRKPDLHYSGLDFQYSPHLETATSLSLYSSWAFDLWLSGLAELQLDTDEFVGQELEQSVLVNKGWKRENLLALFDYNFEADHNIRGNWKCAKCQTPCLLQVQPYWVQKVERIKQGLDPNTRRELSRETEDSSTKSDYIDKARSTWSEESGANATQHRSRVSEKDFDMLDQLSEALKEYKKSDRSGALEEDFRDNASLVSKPGILTRDYDINLIVCIWCWEEHIKNGYKWADEVDDGLRDSGDSDDEYSPYLFRS